MIDKNYVKTELVNPKDDTTQYLFKKDAKCIQISGLTKHGFFAPAVTIMLSDLDVNTFGDTEVYQIDIE